MMTLLEFIQSACEKFGGGASPDDDFLEGVDRVRSHLESIAERYQEPAPEGGEEVRDLMRESIDMFFRALDCLDQYVDEENPKLLALALESAQEGEDLLESVQYAIDQTQETMVVRDTEAE